jgi:hypothetical protein
MPTATTMNRGRKASNRERKTWNLRRKRREGSAGEDEEGT